MTESGKLTPDEQFRLDMCSLILSETTACHDGGASFVIAIYRPKKDDVPECIVYTQTADREEGLDLLEEIRDEITRRFEDTDEGVN